MKRRPSLAATAPLFEHNAAVALPSPPLPQTMLNASEQEGAANSTPPAPIETLSYATLTIDDALDELAAVHDYIARVQPQLNAARAAIADLEAVVAQRLTASGARRYAGRRLRCRYESRKSGSAGIPLPAGLRADLLAAGTVPIDAVNDALPYVTPEPAVKPDLRKVRKLTDYGDVVRVIIERHIVEPREHKYLLIEPVEIDVTAKALPQ